MGSTMSELYQILGLLFTLITVIWGLARYINSRSEAVRKEAKSETDKIRDEAKADSDILHARINDIRNEYVHTDHMDSLIQGIRDSVGNVALEQRRTNDRIDGVLNHLAGTTKG